MSPTTPPRPARFPYWVFVGGAALALGYLPSLTTPFDFIDDGSLVYPAPDDSSGGDYVRAWWDKVRANVAHLGPFRPVLWGHWELFANTFDGDAVAWRVSRLAWCGFAATTLLWLMRELGVPPPAALAAAAAAMWNPYRNEIWTSLTLSEGVAMPYALLALVAARKAACSPAPARWDALAFVSFVAALGCKNTFAALLPALLALRIWPDGVTWRSGWAANRSRVGAYLLPLALPAAHFVYFKLNWQAGHYETPGPSVAQVSRIAFWMKGAAGFDFLGVGLVGVAAALLAGRRQAPSLRDLVGRHRALVLASGCLFSAGVAVYLPVPIMAARYTMPAVWGFDLAFALALTAHSTRPRTPLKALATLSLFVGLAVMLVANVGRQQKFAARSRVLWDALAHLEVAAPPGARLAWVSGETSSSALNAEEGIHFQWHLSHRGRGDLRVGLVTEDGRPIPRDELPPLDGAADFRLAMSPATDPRWEPTREFAAAYWLGQRRFRCLLSARQVAPADGAK